MARKRIGTYFYGERWNCQEQLLRQLRELQRQLGGQPAAPGRAVLTLKAAAAAAGTERRRSGPVNVSHGDSWVKCERYWACVPFQSDPDLCVPPIHCPFNQFSRSSSYLSNTYSLPSYEPKEHDILSWNHLIILLWTSLQYEKLHWRYGLLWFYEAMFCFGSREDLVCLGCREVMGFFGCRKYLVCFGCRKDVVCFGFREYKVCFGFKEDMVCFVCREEMLCLGCREDMVCFGFKEDMVCFVCR